MAYPENALYTLDPLREATTSYSSDGL